MSFAGIPRYPCTRWAASSSWAAFAREQRVEAVAHGQPKLQLGGPLLVVDGRDRAAVLRHPLGQLAVIPDGRGEAHELDVARRLDDDLLPDRAPGEVVDVVDLVQ